MSEHIVKIIPKDPFYKVSEPTLQSVKTFLETRIHCDFIEVEFNEAPVFVDCGTNLETISYPNVVQNLTLIGGEMLWMRLPIIRSHPWKQKHLVAKNRFRLMT